MSLPENANRDRCSDDDASGPSSTKRRKIARACDYCRRKKIKCDGPQRQDGRCSKCISRRTECTYVEPLYKNFYPASYVENLESRMQKMQQLLNKLNPDIDIAKELGDLADAKSSQPPISKEFLGSAPSRRSTRAHAESLTLPPPSPHGSDEFEGSDDESELQHLISEGFRNMSIRPATQRYHGKSSGMVFLRNSVKVKYSSGMELPPIPRSSGYEQRHGFKWKPYPIHPWLLPSVEETLPPFTDFPPDDLLEKLITVYFQELNAFTPLLNELIFREGIRSGLHHLDPAFGATVLLVCANGSMWVRDPRTLLDEYNDPQSAGWRWFEQVERVHTSLLTPPTVYDLQICVLKVQYLQRSSLAHAIRLYITNGIGLAVDMGAHRKKAYSTPPSVEEELMKRAFWALVMLDWGTAHGLGRPCTIHDEDLDLGPIVECDDEYWLSADNQASFQQPARLPAKSAFFNALMRLQQIMAYATRTIYSINKSKTLFGHGEQNWEQRIVSDIDTALNKWVHSLPEHLRWNPEQPNDLFLRQSSILLSSYYFLQIAVHRPFISTRRHLTLTIPSVVICTNAARACVSVVDRVHERLGTPAHQNVGALFTAATVLLINIWGDSRSGRTVNINPDMERVRKAIEMLESLVYEMHTVERLVDALHDLVRSPASMAPAVSSASAPSSLGGQPHPSQPPRSHGSSSSGSSHNGDAAPYNTATSSGYTASTSQIGHRHQQPQPPPQRTRSLDSHEYTFSSAGGAPMPGTRPGAAPFSFDLPLHTEELAQPHAHAASSSAPSSSWAQDSLMAAYHSQAHPQGVAFAPAAHPPMGQFGAGAAADATFGMAYTGYDQGGMGELEHFPGAPGHIQGCGGGAELTEDTLAMWANVPTSFGWDDWGVFADVDARYTAE